MRSFLLSLMIIFPMLLWGQERGAPIQGQLLVQLKPKVQLEQVLQQKRSLASPDKYRLLSTAQRIYLLEYSTKSLPLAQWKTLPEVQYASRNFTIETRALPNDPNYVDQWNLELVQAPAAWDITTGGTTAQGDEIVVAILDTGFKIDHPDLAGNIWFNTGETEGNGVDDDNNGYVDDINGWDFSKDSPNHSSSSHGHRVTGILGAKGDNGIGISGVSWDVKILPMTIGTEAHAIEAFEYLIAQRKAYNDSKGQSGAFIVANNNSWGLSNRFCETDQIWQDLHDRLGAVGILTVGATSNSNINVDQQGDIPSTCDSDYLITVLNSNQSDQKHGQTGFSNVSIDLAAPGENSASLGLQSNFQRFSGTSASAPHVSGTIALMYSLSCAGLAQDALERPAETALLIRKAILDGVDPIAGLDQFTVTGGRLNMVKALEGLQDQCGNATAPFGLSKLFPNPAGDFFTIEFSVPDFDQTYPLQVFNMLGQLVYHTNVSAPRFGPIRHTVPTEKFSPGAYIVVFGAEGNSIERKVVVY
ncbi:MAG: S8 family serine peptidase [Cyanothece sp. SIO1E1]|nr:S8 family serine peptidase [Cyanothece sp. SIO1E1]